MRGEIRFRPTSLRRGRDPKSQARAVKRFGPLCSPMLMLEIDSNADPPHFAAVGGPALRPDPRIRDARTDRYGAVRATAFRRAAAAGPTFRQTRTVAARQRPAADRVRRRRISA